MSCQMPDEESIGDWATTLRGYADPAAEDADLRLLGTGAQRDVFALGRLASEILTGNIANPAAELTGEGMPATLPDLSSWFRRSTARVGLAAGARVCCASAPGGLRRRSVRTTPAPCKSGFNRGSTRHSSIGSPDWGRLLVSGENSSMTPLKSIDNSGHGFAG